MNVNLEFYDSLNEADFERQRQINRLLRWVPRLSVLGSWRLAVTRWVFRLAARGSARRVARENVALEIDKLSNRDTTCVRIFSASDMPRAVVVDFHGGAWAIGLAAMDDRLNAGIARACRMTVVSVDYQLALPRTILDVREECISATRSLLERPEFSGLPVFLTGESAGAHLALCVAQDLCSSDNYRDRLAGMVLNYGAYDLGGTPSAFFADSNTLVLAGKTLLLQIELLCGEARKNSRRAPDLSPLYGPMKGLPPALIVAGGLDPLVDDSRELTKAMERAGSEGDMLYLLEAPHGMLHMRGPYAAKLRRYEREWYNRRIEAFPDRGNA